MIETRAAGEAALLHRLEAAMRLARARGERVLLSWTERHPEGTRALDPLTFLERASDARSWYWEQPDEGFGLAAVGVAASLGAAGEDRFGVVARAWRSLLEKALIEDQADGMSGTGPVAMGGFAFDPCASQGSPWDRFPAARLVLPRYMLTASDGESWLTVNLLADPGDDPLGLAGRVTAELRALRRTPPGGACSPGSPSLPPHRMVPLRSAESWKGLVASTAGAIRRGRAEKIVLARAVRCEWQTPLAPWAALRRLRQTYPGCTLFAVAEGPGAFLGATPERLVRLRRREVHVDCLAGTVGRGSTDAEDRQLAERMLSSAKDRSEHAVVVRELREKLTDLCSDLHLPPMPAVMTLRNVQHLHTPIRGRLATDDCILSLVERLHPSPAVGGFPTAAALRFIRE
ncbi:MAG: chorismate-binding protein, partial [Chloroflexi bacterium]|nr:chorismate-binding protein [Chloroflexota bacterium]